MIGNGEMFFPPWLKKVPAAERDYEQRKFLLRLAALYHSREGTMEKMSTSMDMHPRSLAHVIHQGCNMSPELCVKIEKLVGRRVAPREAFNLDLFNIPAA